MWSIWFTVHPSGDIQVPLCTSLCENRLPPILNLFVLHQTRMLKFKIEVTSFALIRLTVHCRMHEESFSITCLSDLDILTRSGGICDPSLKLCEINPHFELWSTNKKVKSYRCTCWPTQVNFFMPWPLTFLHVLEIDLGLLAHIPNGDWSTPKNFKGEH